MLTKDLRKSIFLMSYTWQFMKTNTSQSTVATYVQGMVGGQERKRFKRVILICGIHCLLSQCAS